MNSIITQLQQLIATHTDDRRPFVIQSLGMSLDGKIATHTGDSKYISGPESRQLVHELRNLVDGILVGIHTIQIDHPQLTTRLNHRQGRDAHRIILDSKLSISLDEPILQIASSAKTIIATTEYSSKIPTLEQMGVIVLVIAKDAQGRVDLTDLMVKLHQWGIHSLLVEGGSTIHFSFLQAHLIDYSFFTLSPLIIGGDRAKSAVGGEGFATLREATRFTHLDILPLGVDYVFHGAILK